MPARTIVPLSDAAPVRYAAEELARCLSVITGEAVTVAKAAGATCECVIRIGPASELPDAGVPPVADAELDDAVAVRVAGGSGVIAGANPRSVLLGVYRLLTALGCRWVRPGPLGELLPRLPISEVTASFTETPFYRHRGLCIEGAVCEEHVRDIIEWLPRVGMNAYFFQFREAYTFFERWYSHRNNPLTPPEPFTVEDARAMVGRLSLELARRGLVHHAVGHGWTCEPFGMEGLGWEYPPPPVPADAVPFLALVNGERQVWEGVPLNTNLCYSNPEVRRRIVASIVEYAAGRPDVDILHFWLADGANNHCECPACAATRPSDFYVQMLNELDRALTQAGLATRIVFLIYVDLLWPPETQRLANPGRFLLMFAPITRSYSEPFDPGAGRPELAPFERNHLEFPKSVPENVAFLRAWQAGFSGDAFDFDYHLMWDHYNDPGYRECARILHADIARLHTLGLAGFVSCQTQRAFFPTGLPMAALAQTLWSRDAEFDAICADYDHASFGEGAETASAYLEAMTAAFDPVAARGERPGPDIEALADVAGRADAVLSLASERQADPDPCRAESWRLLGLHARLCVLLASAYAHRAAGDRGAAHAAWREVAQFVRLNEPALASTLDVYLFINTLQGRFPAA